MKQFLFSAAVALIITLLIRFTLFTDDCNLFVVSMAFLIIFIVTYAITYVTHNLWKHHK